MTSNQKEIKILKNLKKERERNQNVSAVPVFRPVNILSPDYKPTLKSEKHQFQPRIVF